MVPTPSALHSPWRRRVTSVPGLYKSVELFVYTGAVDTVLLPPLISKIPSICGTVVRVSSPVLIVKLLKVVVEEPLTVPAPANSTVPLPLVKLVEVPPLLVKVPPDVIVSL